MFTLFHVSDLHVGKELVPKVPVVKGLYAHNIKIWAKFREHILNQISRVGNDYIITVTGDLSQFGNISSFMLTEKFLFDTDSDISNEVGLKQNRDKVVIVPGNHDSCDDNYLLQNNLIEFNRIFYPSKDADDIYPAFKRIELGGVRIAIVVFDSTYKKSATTPAKKFGKGLVSKDQLKEATGFIRGLEQNYIKILCLHHSPIILDHKRNRNLMLDKSHELLNWIAKNKIDIVLCGHLHDDFYDILPLRKLIKFLPVRKNISKMKRRLFKESHLNDFYQISINGKKARYIDSIAYHYLKKDNDNIKDINDTNFENIYQFNKYLHSLDDYKVFVDDFGVFMNDKTAIILAGSVCQLDEENGNSYLELKFDNSLNKIYFYRHKYKKETNEFETKQREIDFRVKGSGT